MIIDDLKEQLVQNIYGLGHKKALPIAEYVLFSTLAMLRGRNKNPVIDNAGSMSVKYFQELFNVNRGLCAKILDFCFDRGEEYRTGACKPSIPKPWLKEMTYQYVSENHYRSDELMFQAGRSFNFYPINGKFYVEFQLPIDNIKAAIKEAKMLMNADEYHDSGELKNNRDEYSLAKVYLEAGLQRDGYFCEKYEYKPCGRMYQTGYGFQNNVDINSSFFRMAWDLFSREWSTDLQTQIKSLLDDKDNFYANISNPREFKINLLSILLGSRNIEILNSSAYLRHLNNLLNDWMTPARRRKHLATHLFKREQEYVKELIEQLQKMPHVLIHDGFIIQNNYQLDEKIWSIKQL
jgi:hypothetical protein